MPLMNEAIGPCPLLQKYKSFTARLIIGVILLYSLLFNSAFGYWLFQKNLYHIRDEALLNGQRHSGPRAESTLVIYVYSDTDEAYLENMSFFYKHAVADRDGCRYIFVLQSSLEYFDEMEVIPGFLQDNSVPVNVEVIVKRNSCYDIGTIGEVISQVDVTPYKYFFWVNSSVRGPFLPPYLQGKMHWTQPFVAKLNTRVKLVGSTINCGGLFGYPESDIPHVQSYVVATDADGMAILNASESVFRCYLKFHDVIMHSEIGASLAMYQAGYSIDSLMLRYKDVNWRQESSKNCNSKFNPLEPPFHNDGLYIDPYEVLFVKVKTKLLRNPQIYYYATAAQKISDWMS